eukprot:TRINITY_DN6385_c0_g1_i1.p1 TRINITY_DN6385_c0_g1~~TRINITY_DN6385_c0_g1_i1.p1  ORF type:complete len:263 (+),score=30.40 TRINITY_DN6385_c0_g1_i1:68-790(+)
MAYGSSDEEEDIGFLCNRTLPNQNSRLQHQKNEKGGSGGLVPSKSTVYVANLDYSLTNSDLITIFSRFGKVARVTVMKDKETRHSKGVAFVLFAKREEAIAAVKEMKGKSLNGRKLTVSIAADNGRAPEFIRKRVYKDKSRCYECGEPGHLSYECPRNLLGPRERPPPKKSRRFQKANCDGDDAGGSEEDEAVFEDDNWASVVDQRGIHEIVTVSNSKKKPGASEPKKPKYFSDESDDED